MDYGEFINFLITYQYIISAILLLFIGLGTFFLLRWMYIKMLNRLFVNIWISPVDIRQSKALITDKIFREKGKDESDKTAYGIDKKAIITTIRGSKKIKTINFIKGIEKPFIYNFKTDLLEFMGADTFAQLLDNKAFVEVASLYKDNKINMKTILIILGFIALAALAYLGYTQGWFTSGAGAGGAR